MKANKGYLLPPELEPENDRCFVVYVPDADEYVLAFFGGLTGYEKWNLWERTGDNSGALAAARWKLANERTFLANEILDCELLNDLLEDGDMSINITNNITCSECGGSGGGGCSCPTNPPTGPIQPENLPPPQAADDIRNLPDDVGDPGGDLTPPGFDSRELYEAFKCRAARALARDVIQTIYNLGGVGIIVGIGGAILLQGTLASTALLATLAAPLAAAGLAVLGPLAAPALVIAALVMAAVVGTVMFGYFHLLGQSLEGQIDDLTCEFFCANSATEARQALIDRTTVSIGELIYEDAAHESLFASIVEQVMSFFLPKPFFQILFGATAAIEAYLETRDEQFDCSTCECVEETVPAGYTLVPAILACQDPVQENLTCDITANTLEANFSTNDGSQSANLVKVAHGEVEWHAVVYDVVWNVGTWRQVRFGAQNAGLTWSIGETVVMAAGNLGSTARAAVEAWAVENGYHYHHDTDIAPTTQAEIDHVARLEYPATQVSTLVIRYRFLIPN